MEALFISSTLLLSLTVVCISLQGNANAEPLEDKQPLLDFVSPRFSNSFSPSPEPSMGSATSPTESFRPKEMVGIFATGFVSALCGVSFLVCFCSRQKRRNKNTAATSSDTQSISASEESTNRRLVLFGDCNYKFDAMDLMKSSTEILGSSNLGTTYKVILEDTVNVVVKNLKSVGATKRHFKQVMEAVGRIQHANVAPLRGYYFSDDIKMMLYDFYTRRSLSSILHGPARGLGLNWNTRMKIALGAAKGLACIHLAEDGNLVHGNVKSSNIFLTSDHKAMVSDLGQVSVTGARPPPISETVANRAPEAMITWKAGQPADIYGFGIVLLELLTGKAPIFRIGFSGIETSALVMWVSTVITQEWTCDVFDVVLTGNPIVEAEMVEMLHIAMRCVETDYDDRPTMSEVVTMIEGIRDI